MLKKKRKKVASRIWCHHCAAFVLERNWCSFSSWYILSSVFVLLCLSATKLHELINLCRHLPEGELFFNGLSFLSNFSNYTCSNWTDRKVEFWKKVWQCLTMRWNNRILTKLHFLDKSDKVDMVADFIASFCQNTFEKKKKIPKQPL